MPAAAPPEFAAVLAAERIEAPLERAHALGDAYAAWKGHCAEAKVAYEAALQHCGACAAVKTLEGKLKALHDACAVSISTSLEKPRVDGVERSAGALKVWPGVRTIQHDGRERMFCGKEGLQLGVAKEDARWLPIHPAKDKEAEAKRQEAAAIAHLKKEEFCEAEARLKKLNEALPNPAVLFNIALVIAKQPARCSDAIEAYTQYLKACPDCKAAADAKRRLEDVKTTCIGELVVATEPSGLDVRIDEKSHGPSPLSAKLAPGRHAVAAETPAGQVVMPVYVEFDKTTRVTLKKMAEVAKAPEKTLATSAASEVANDSDSTSIVTDASPEGAEWGAPPVWTWVSWGVAAAAGVSVGVLFKAVEDRNQTFSEGGFTSRGEAQTFLDGYKPLRIGYTASWIIAGAGLVAGAGLWWLDTPVVAPTPNGLTLAGRF